MFFPIICVDDFYEDPDIVRKYALSLDYFKDDNATYPGLRTKQLSQINPTFFNDFCFKILSLFFNSEKDKVNVNVSTTFQKIYPYNCSKKYKEIINSGWVHKDVYADFAGVIYLNPNPNLSSGTSIYELKKNQNEKFDFSIRDKFYNKEENICENQYVKEKINHNSKFYKTLEVKNQYNRLLVYDSCYWHSQSKFLMDTEDFRLTQVFFVKLF